MFKQCRIRSLIIWGIKHLVQDLRRQSPGTVKLGWTGNLFFLQDVGGTAGWVGGGWGRVCHRGYHAGTSHHRCFIVFYPHTSRRLCSKFWHPPTHPRSIWKDLMMNTVEWQSHGAATSIIFFTNYQHYGPELSFGGDRSWKLKQKAVKAAGSGRELGSDLCHSFRSTPPDLRGWGWGADRRTLALSPLWSRAGTQMLLCYSGKWIPARNLYTKAEMVVEEEVEQAGLRDDMIVDSILRLH